MEDGKQKRGRGLHDLPGRHECADRVTDVRADVRADWYVHSVLLFFHRFPRDCSRWNICLLLSFFFLLLVASPTLPENRAFDVDAADDSVHYGFGSATTAQMGLQTDVYQCITDGPNWYGNNEEATITVRRDGAINSKGTFKTNTQLQSTGDYLMIGGTAYGGSNAPINVRVSQGDTFTWHSDASRRHKGWTVCLEEYVPTASPTLNPTDAPTLNPTDAPTLSPTGAPTLNPLRAFDIARVNNYDSGIIFTGAGEDLDQCITDGPGNYGECIFKHLAQTRRCASLCAPTNHSTFLRQSSFFCPFPLIASSYKRQRGAEHDHRAQNRSAQGHAVQPP